MCGSALLDASWTKDPGCCSSSAAMAPALTQATHQRQALSLHTIWQSPTKKKQRLAPLSTISQARQVQGVDCQQTALDPPRKPSQDARAVASALFSYPAPHNGLENNVNINSSSAGDGIQCSGSNGIIMGLQQRTGADNLVHDLDGPVIDDVMELAKGDRPPVIDDSVEDILQVISSIANEVSSSQGSVGTGVGDLELTPVEQQLLREAAAVINLCPEEDKEALALQRLEQTQSRLELLEQRCDQALRRACRLTTRQSAKVIAGHVSDVERHLRERLGIKAARSANAQNLYGWAEDGRLPTREEVRSIPTATLVSLVNKLQAPPTPQVNNRRYFGVGPSHSASSSSSYVVGNSRLPSSVAEQLEDSAGTWTSQLRHLQRFDDPDATESSSGGESDEEGPVCESLAPPPADEQGDNQPEAQPRPVSLYHRAIWRWYRERASIASKWTWLQAQIADLEYRIRQHTDLYRQLRATKGSVQLAGLNGVVVSSPLKDPLAAGLSADGSECEMSSRTCPLLTSGGSSEFRKRRLIRTSLLTAAATTSRRGGRTATIRCGCVASTLLSSCVLCVGRSKLGVMVVDPDGMALKERVAATDRGFHAVLSMDKDIATGVHVDSLLKTGDWRNYNANGGVASFQNARVEDDGHATKRKYVKRRFKTAEDAVEGQMSSKPERRKYLMKKRKRLATCGEVLDDDSSSFPPSSPFSVTGDGSSGAAALWRSRERHSLQDIVRRRTSYDIDNIVIPASMVATSRVEKWEYKEIITPKWRLIEQQEIVVKGPEEVIKQEKDAAEEVEEEEEDISDEAYKARHDRSEAEERRKFLSYLKPPLLGRGRHRRTERADSRAESSGANSPDPMSPNVVEEASKTHAAVDVVGDTYNETSLSRVSVNIDNKEDAAILKSMKERRPTVLLTRQRDLSRVPSEENSCVAWDSDETFAVNPYEPRSFPIGDGEYESMVAEMPEDEYKMRDNRTDDLAAGSPPASSVGSLEAEQEQEDPDDPEWQGGRHSSSKARKR